MKFQFGKNGECIINLLPQEMDTTIDILVYLYDTRVIDLQTRNQCIFHLKYAGIDIPDNLVFLPIDDMIKH